MKSLCRLTRFAVCALVYSSTAIAQTPHAARSSAAASPDATISANPGSLVRWTAPGARRCTMKTRSWAALQGTCYFPIDLEETSGQITIAIRGSGKKREAHISVEPFDYGTEEVTLPDIPQAHPSPDDLKRVARDRTLLGQIYRRPETPARFTLPLGEPLHPMPKAKSFGVKRVYNGKDAEQAHMGSDYDAPVDSPVHAVGAGTVVLAKELFYEGNAVFINHGDGLISEYFHLGHIQVKTGQRVRKGEVLGTEGSTGRATGPHLWFGVRWHDARIDPKLLLGAPTLIPSVNRAAP